MVHLQSMRRTIKLLKGVVNVTHKFLVVVDIVIRRGDRLAAARPFLLLGDPNMEDVFHSKILTALTDE